MPNYSIGGINRYIVDLCKAQNESKKLQSDIYVLNAKHEAWKEKVADIGCNIYEGKFQPKDINFARINSFCIIKEKYDVINWHVPFPTLMLACIGDSKKHVYTHHSVLGTGRTKSFMDFLKWGIFKWLINGIFDAQIFNSDFTRQFWKSRGLCTRVEKLVYNPITPMIQSQGESMVCEKWPQLGKMFVVGTACSMVRCKRLDLLINAFNCICKECRESVLFLVGDGPERSNLEKLVEARNLCEHVVFAGYQTEVADFINAMDVFVSSSVGETFGLAVGEAMSLGKPAICLSDGGGVCEVVGCDSGNVVSTESELAFRLKYYMEKKQKLGSCEMLSNVERVKKFAMNEVVNKYVDVYSMVLN